VKPPLTGIRVLDLTGNMAGPYATLILAEQGADVVKVEAPSGDVIRRVGSGRGGMSAYFANLNRGKRSIAIDLTTEAGVELLLRLAQQSDVVIQAFRPGVADKLGIGAEKVRALAPRVIYASISGYGSVGPLAGEPAYDQVIQALSGMASLQRASDDGPAELIRHGVVDKTTGMAIAQAVTAALLQRERQGTGCEIEVSMLDSALHFLWPDGMMNTACLEPLTMRPPVSRSFRLTKTLDGQVSIVTVTDRQWTGLIEAVGMGEILDDPEFQGPEARLKNGGRVMRQVAAKLGEMSTDTVVRALRARGVPCMPVVEIDRIAEHEQVVAAETIVESDHPILGRMRHPRPPARVRSAERVSLRSAPVLGGDVDDVLAEVGLTNGEIGELRESGVIS
jgi:crotonobetainyl-CoA:carnitine CoA-transferase CaiB-like acyl-CoA transferase